MWQANEETGQFHVNEVETHCSKGIETSNGQMITRVNRPFNHH